MKTLLDIEQFAKENYIPIARKQTVQFILDLIKKNHYQSFLEIGTAIGYTTINVAVYNKNMKIVTIEHDVDRAILAKENFCDFHVEKGIHFITDDAEFVELKEKFDLIFIDASKKKNEFFFEKFSPLLNPNGVIIVDNMNLKDFWVDANEKKVIKFQKMNNEFKHYLMTLSDYNVQIIDNIGDGIALITKK